MKKAVRYTIVGLFIAAIPAAVIGYNIYALVEFLGIRDLEQNGIAKEAKVVAKEVSGTTRNNTFRVTLRYPSGVGIDSITTKEVIDDQLYGILHVDGSAPIRQAIDDPSDIYVVGNNAYIKTLIFAGAGDLLLIFLCIGVYRIYRKSKLPHGPPQQAQNPQKR